MSNHKLECACCECENLRKEYAEYLRTSPDHITLSFEQYKELIEDDESDEKTQLLLDITWDFINQLLYGSKPEEYSEQLSYVTNPFSIFHEKLKNLKVETTDIADLGELGVFIMLVDTYTSAIIYHAHVSTFIPVGVTDANEIEENCEFFLKEHLLPKFEYIFYLAGVIDDTYEHGTNSKKED